MIGERGVSLGALGMIGLCALVRGLPEYVVDGVPIGVRPDAWTLGPGLERLPADGELHLRLSCAADPCRGEATVALPASAHPMAAGAWAVRNGVGNRSRLVLVSERPPARYPGFVVTDGGPVVATAPAWAHGGALVAALVNDGEALRLRDVWVAPAKRSGVRVGAWVAWWVAAGGLVAAALRVLEARLSPRARWFVAATAALVVIGVAMPVNRLHELLLLFPGTDPEDLSGRLLEDPTPTVLLQKLGGHGSAFALLGLAGGVTGGGVVPVARRLLLVAALSEALQWVRPDRSGHWVDVAVDLAGALLGWGVGAAWLRSRAAAPPAPPGSAASRP